MSHLIPKSARTSNRLIDRFASHYRSCRCLDFFFSRLSQHMLRGVRSTPALTRCKHSSRVPWRRSRA
jgi:hypothetical protein